jgi:hypothetical protein
VILVTISVSFSESFLNEKRFELLILDIDNFVEFS